MSCKKLSPNTQVFSAVVNQLYPAIKYRISDICRGIRMQHPENHKLEILELLSETPEK